MKNEKSIAALNNLIEINNDRLQGYETAAKETEEHDLKSLFSRLSKTSTTCITALTAEVERLGGTPTEGTRTSGKFFRLWMDVKAAITGKDRKAILSSCEYGEDAAVDAYANELKNHSAYLTTDQLAMLRKQHTLITADHDEIKSLRDSVIEHAAV